MEYKIQEKVLKLLENNKATNLRVGCKNKFNLDCGGSAVYINLKEVEDEIIYLNNFIGSDANGFYVIIDE